MDTQISNFLKILRRIFDSQKELLLDDLNKGEGDFFICNHLGNVDAMRAFVNSDIKDTCTSISVFLAKEQCKTFGSFINKITKNEKIFLNPVEDIDINTSIEIQERLNNGGIVFIAGDRISANSINFEVLMEKMGYLTTSPSTSLNASINS